MANIDMRNLIMNRSFTSPHGLTPVWQETSNRTLDPSPDMLEFSRHQPRALTPGVNALTISLH